MTFFIYYVLICSFIRTELSSTNVNILAPTVSLTSNAVISYVDEYGDDQKAYSATRITRTTATLDSGWYYVDTKVTTQGGETITLTGPSVNIILTDGSELVVNKGISGSPGTSLNIYGQTESTGILTVKGDYRKGGISVSDVTINGGFVNATGGDYGSGIGGGYGGNGGTVTIRGGVVIAHGGADASGIGGGGNGGIGNTVTISGGSVKVSRGYHGNADIGTGQGGTNNGTLIDKDGSPVYLNIITIKTYPPEPTPDPEATPEPEPEAETEVRNTTITALVVNGVSSYGLKGVVMDEHGKLYFYLPATEGEEIVALTVGGVEYRGRYARKASHNNIMELVACEDADLTPEEYAALACPVIPVPSAASLKRPLALTLAAIAAVIVWLM